MKDLTVITISVSYSDYLEVYLEYNTKIFDNIVIITYDDDNDTIELVERYPAVKLVKFPSQGFPLPRGKMTNPAIESAKTPWKLLLDADIIVPEEISRIDLNLLNKEAVYGTPRYIIPNVVAFRKYLAGSRKFYLENGIGYGYFQLFSKNREPYNEEHKGIDLVDLWFKDSFKLTENLNIPVGHVGPIIVNKYERKSWLWS